MQPLTAWFPSCLIPPLDDLATVVCAMPMNVLSDPIVAAIADRLLWSDGRHVSYTALAESSSIDSYCHRQKQLMAASVLSNDLLARFALERQVSYPITDFDLVFHVVYKRFDESTMPISVRRWLMLRATSTIRAGCIPQSDTKDSGPCRNVQSTQSFGMVLKNKAVADGAERNGCFVTTGDTLTPVQTVDPSATEVILQLARSCSGASLASMGFRTTAGVVTGDHHGAQLKAERVMQAELGGVFPFSEAVRRTRLHKSTRRRSL